MKVNNIAATIVLCIVLTPLSAVFAAVERVDYGASGSNVHRRQMQRDSAGTVVSGTSWFAFGLFPAVQWPSFDHEVTGFRLNVFAGEHVDVYGLDIGLFSNMVKREIGGLQVAGLFNVAGESECAVQIAPACNCVRGDFGGLQLSLVNVTEKGRGVQIGIVNSADILYGVQIGVLNFIRSSTVPFCPIVNCAF